MCEIKNDETIVQRSIVHMGGGRRGRCEKMDTAENRGKYISRKLLNRKKVNQSNVD